MPRSELNRLNATRRNQHTPTQDKTTKRRSNDEAAHLTNLRRNCETTKQRTKRTDATNTARHEPLLSIYHRRASVDSTVHRHSPSFALSLLLLSSFVRSAFVNVHRRSSSFIILSSSFRHPSSSFVILRRSFVRSFDRSIDRSFVRSFVRSIVRSSFVR